MHSIGDAFIAITPDINLEELKATLIKEGKASTMSPAGSPLVHWKYPSDDAETNYCTVDTSERYQILIKEQTPYYAIFLCEGTRYIARNIM